MTQKRRPSSVRRRRSPPGTAPGTLSVDPRALTARLHAMHFNADGLVEIEHPEIAPPEPGKVLWLNIDGLGDAALLAQIGAAFGLHPLVLEDIVNVHQRPKTEEYQGQTFVVLRMPSPHPDGFDTEQVSLVLGETFVLTFQEKPGDVFEPVRNRLRAPHRPIRARSADYLCYALIDAVIDSFFPVVETMTEQLEAVEERVLLGQAEVGMAEIHAHKREIMAMRGAVWPLRDVVTALMREDHGQISAATRLYLRDCQDHVVQLTEMLQSSRDVTGGLVDLVLSSQSHRTNEVMRVLTLISTIFIPLTFVVGVYGMNFDHMPELHWRWGYPVALGLMAALAVGLLAWFRAIGWLGRNRR